MLDIGIKRFAIYSVILASFFGVLVGAIPTILTSNAKEKVYVDMNEKINLVCLDGIEYYYNHRLLAPRYNSDGLIKKCINLEQ